MIIFPKWTSVSWLPAWSSAVTAANSFCDQNQMSFHKAKYRNHSLDQHHQFTTTTTTWTAIIHMHLESSVPLGFFLHLFWDRTFGDKVAQVFTGWMPFLSPNPKKTERNSKQQLQPGGLASFSLCPPPGSWGRGTAPFTLVRQHQDHYHSLDLKLELSANQVLRSLILLPSRWLSSAFNLCI